MNQNLRTYIAKIITRKEMDYYSTLLVDIDMQFSSGKNAFTFKFDEDIQVKMHAIYPEIQAYFYKKLYLFSWIFISLNNKNLCECTIKEIKNMQNMPPPPIRIARLTTTSESSICNSTKSLKSTTRSASTPATLKSPLSSPPSATLKSPPPPTPATPISSSTTPISSSTTPATPISITTASVSNIQLVQSPTKYLDELNVFQSNNLRNYTNNLRNYIYIYLGNIETNVYLVHILNQIEFQYNIEEELFMMLDITINAEANDFLTVVRSYFHTINYTLIWNNYGKNCHFRLAQITNPWPFL